ncbi:MAG TPA: nucleotidyltransferase domain-containing protein [Tepidisphaeraceae bacterium]|jgi:hypothetical protein
MPLPLPSILPIGTAVVALVDVAGHVKGTAGKVVRSPVDSDHRYGVCFPGGDEVNLLRRQFQVLAQYQADESTHATAEYDWSQHVIYRCVVGSRAYGLDRDASDTDRRGIYLPPARLHWSIEEVPEQLENDADQSCYWELKKYLRMALKANPNVLETLWSPMVEYADEIAQELLHIRTCFLSKLVFQTFNGYAMSQFRKIEQDVRNHGQVKWKHAMHLIRLLHSGIHVLRHGQLQVYVGDHRAPLLAVRDGAMPWGEVDQWRKSLHAEFEQAFVSTQLPDRPDDRRANQLLLRARRTMADREKEHQ